MEATHLKRWMKLDESVFPLRPDWSAPRFLWQDQYPPGVPPGLDYKPLRAEQLLLSSHDLHPERMAIRYYCSNWTYDELVRRIQQAAANLQRLGVGTGDRVLMVLPNCPDFVVAWFALHWLGAEVVPANPLLSAKDLLLLAQITRPKAVIGLDIRLKPVLQFVQQYQLPLLLVGSLSSSLPCYLRWPYRLKCGRLPRQRVPTGTDCLPFNALYDPTVEPLQAPFLSDPNRPAVLQPTGGTTGTPKVAVLTHANLHANVAQLHAWCGLEAGNEVVLAVLPFFHVFGATVAFLSPISGAATLLLQTRFDLTRVWKVMERWEPGVAPMVPFMFASLCQEMRRRRKNIRGLRFCFSGASALTGEVKQEFQERTGATIFEGYGLSEASPVTHTNPPDGNARIGSVGLPLPDTCARIVDTETGTCDLPIGQVGELVIKGPQVMSGYLNQPEETAQVLRDGWLYTGDLARMDEEGFFYIVDRKKDMIISAGLNVFPAEVEKVLALHPDIAECAVVGLPDRLYGERVVAYVVPAKGCAIDSRKLRSYCRSQMSAYKVPRTFEICDELPRTFLGKIRRVELRSRVA